MENMYSVSMCATSDTYVYGIYRFDGEHVRLAELSLSDVRELNGGLRNNADALVWLNANAGEVFDRVVSFEIV